MMQGISADNRVKEDPPGASDCADEGHLPQDGVSAAGQRLRGR
jgi:hypothetical protein